MASPASGTSWRNRIGFLLFGIFMARRVKQLGDRHNHLTYPDFIEQHYDNRTRAVATITTVLAYTAYTAGQFAASAAILEVLLGWSYGTALLLSGAIVILYTAVGGYLAVTYTDRVQVALVLLGHRRDRSARRDLARRQLGRHARRTPCFVLRSRRPGLGPDRGAGRLDGAQLLRGDGQFFPQLRRARRGNGAHRRPAHDRARAADRARRRLAWACFRGPLSGPRVRRRHSHDFRSRGFSRGAERPHGDRHPVGHDVGRGHLRHHGVGELHARHPPALHPAGYFPPAPCCGSARWHRWEQACSRC